MASATAGIRRPPALPADIAYTSHYCEENIYLLAQAFYDQLSVREAWDIFVVFISNHTKTVALKNQKLGRDGVVVWDYHVILVVRPKAADWFAPSTPADSDVVSTMSWVYDFDSRSTNPSPWPDYALDTFDLQHDFPPHYQSLFRVIPCLNFLGNFASDRSHMLTIPSQVEPVDQTLDEPVTLTPDQIYAAPPPTYPPICGPGAMEQGVAHNLMTRFVHMGDGLLNQVDMNPTDSDQFGVVSDLEGLVNWLTHQ